MRLKWILENDSNVKAALEKGVLMFGTIDTWLVYKLTGGKVIKISFECINFDNEVCETISQMYKTINRLI